MKIRKRLSLRVAAVVLLMILTGVSLWTGFPVLAAEIGTDAAAAAGQQNLSPIAENLSYSTFRNIPIKGRFAAQDPEGDAVSFEIKDMPKLGTVKAEEDGSFVYTPNENRKGRDSFSYVAVDTAGNTSDKGVVSIAITKQSTNIMYSDMADNASHYAALVLAEKGVLTGEQLGNEYFFRPDMPVTRGEFLAMCLALSNTETIPGITRTGFHDDASIPLWTKPYVSTALMSGIIAGFKDGDGQLIFASSDPITVSEAAVILDNMLGITDVVAVASLEQEACPTWSQQAEVNLAACNILTPAELHDCSTSVTRAEAADMLVSSVTILDARKTNHSLLDWLK